MTASRWTDDDLRAAGIGVSMDSDVARAIGCTREYVRQRRNKMGLAAPGKHYPQKFDREATMAALVGRSHAEAATMLGLTKQGVTSRVIMMRAEGRDVPMRNTRIAITDAERAVLVLLAATSRTLITLATEVGCRSGPTHVGRFYRLRGLDLNEIRRKAGVKGRHK